MHTRESLKKKVRSYAPILEFPYFYRIPSFVVSHDSAVGIATVYGLDGRGVGVRVPVGVRFSSSRPDRFCDPPVPLLSEHRG
jgi:hypothetical protein